VRPKIAIIYEDEYLLAVNKPARMASVPGERIALAVTALGEVQRMCRERGDVWAPYLLHRIDMQTSGLLMFGKHERDRDKLEGILRMSDTMKKYTTLVKGIPKGHVITAKLKARESGEKIFAQTKYRVVRVYKLPELKSVVSLVEAEIVTGRRHQIRQHFSDIGCPVVLDGQYGDFAFNRKFRLALRLGRMFLHASSIEFTHPFSGKRIALRAELPPDLEMTLEKIRS
jgi:23S rRNA pseudouridine955/2504/2580 synthase